MDRSNVIDLTLSDHRNPTLAKSNFINPDADIEGNGNEATSKSPPKPTNNISPREASHQNKGSSRPADFYHATCATSGCKNVFTSRAVGAFCKKCEITKRHEASRVAAQEKKDGTPKAAQSSQARSPKAAKHNSQNIGPRPTAPRRSSVSNDIESDSDSLPELSQIFSPSKARLSHSTTVLPTKDFALNSLKAPVSRSTDRGGKSFTSGLRSDRRNEIKSVPISARHLQKASPPSKGKSKLVIQIATSHQTTTRSSASAGDTSTNTLEDNLKSFPSLLEKERTDLVTLELHRNTSIQARGFLDEESPWAKLDAIEIPGKGLDVALKSLTASTKINSIPFIETRCLVNKVPPYKHFVFISENIIAQDNKILRFRPFEDFPLKSAVDRAREERHHYDLVIEPKDHQAAMVIAENYAALYKHLPSILESLNCTEADVSDQAKKAFAKVFESQDCDLQDLIDCREGTFDVADFLENEDSDLYQKEGSEHEVSEQEEGIYSSVNYPGGAIEPFSTYWQLRCPYCSRLKCGCGDVFLVPHSSALSKQRHAAHDRDVDEISSPCSRQCYRSNNQIQVQESLWATEAVEFLKAFIFETRSDLACTLTGALNKDCNDIQQRLVRLRKENSLNLNEVSMPNCGTARLSWYDNKKKRLLWKNPGEMRESTDDTDVHRHEQMPKVKPCCHSGPCSDKIGGCHEKGLCNKFCLCPEDCPLRFTGCDCAMTYGACSTYTCPCRALGFECDPDLCKSCGAVENCHPRHRHKPLEDGSCQNVALQRAATPLFSVGESTFEGWGYGLFACENIEAGSFLGEYVGEIVTQAEAERRGIVYEEYFFTLNKEQSIDATRFGNFMRFVNGTYPEDKLISCSAKVLSVGGKHRIGFFAKKKIFAGHEIFMDYGSDYEKKHMLHGGGTKKRKENPKDWTIGNHAGQVAVVVDDNTTVPVVGRGRLQAEVKGPSPLRLSTRRLVRGLRKNLEVATERDIYEFTNDDESPRPISKALTQPLLPIDTTSAECKALSTSEKRSLLAKARWAKQRSRGLGFGVGKGKETTHSSPPSSRSVVREGDKVMEPDESSSLGSFRDSEDEEDVGKRPKRRKQVPLRFTQN